MPKARTHEARIPQEMIPQNMIRPRMTAPHYPRTAKSQSRAHHPIVVRPRGTSKPHVAIKASNGLAHVEDSGIIVKELSRMQTETRGEAGRSLS